LVTILGSAAAVWVRARLVDVRRSGHHSLGHLAFELVEAPFLVGGALLDAREVDELFGREAIAYRQRRLAFAVAEPKDRSCATASQVEAVLQHSARRETTRGKQVVTAPEAAARVVIRPLGEPGDLGWVVMAHGEVYASEFGWDTSFEALVARIVADYAAGHDPSRDAAWIAELDGRRVGCVFCVAADAPYDATTAKLRILLVHPDGRGHGLGGRLVDVTTEFARAAGYSRMRLWTNDPLVAARRIYLARGFTLIEEEPHRSFGVDLVGQTYELDLSENADVASPQRRSRKMPESSPQPATVPRPHHLNLASEAGDVDRIAAFYRDFLGLTPVELPRDEGSYGANIHTMEDRSGYQYHFVPAEPDFSDREGLPVNPLVGHLAFRVDDIAALRDRLDAARIPYSDMGVWAIKGWHQLFCTDPVGRVVEFHQVVDGAT
jgi:GNAT superfamily N-acetyltransferase/catechol 2,3-dioxygenase-like lactoylglutathione lyase family enzyme